MFVISLARHLKEERNKVRHLVDRLALDLEFRGLRVLNGVSQIDL